MSEEDLESEEQEEDSISKIGHQYHRLHLSPSSSHHQHQSLPSSPSSSSHRIKDRHHHHHHNKKTSDSRRKFSSNPSSPSVVENGCFDVRLPKKEIRHPASSSNNSYSSSFPRSSSSSVKTDSNRSLLQRNLEEDDDDDDGGDEEKEKGEESRHGLHSKIHEEEDKESDGFYEEEEKEVDKYESREVEHDVEVDSRLGSDSSSEEEANALPSPVPDSPSDVKNLSVDDKISKTRSREEDGDEDQDVKGGEESDEDFRPTAAAEVTEEMLQRINNEEWDHVNGIYDSAGNWREWYETVTVINPYDGEEFVILPYVHIDF